MAVRPAVRKKARNKKDENILYLTEVVSNNGAAVKEGPKVKKFTLHDLKNIAPLTEAQRQLFESYFNSDVNILGIGSAGAGKSFISLWLALNTILSSHTPQNKIIIVRTIVTTGKDMGALPGELCDKIRPFEQPYYDIVNCLMSKNTAYENLKEVGSIEFMPTTFIRGLTWDNAIVIVDEIQNMEWQELTSVCTRLGDNSRLLLLGDGAQTDLDYTKKTKSGFDNIVKVLGTMNEDIDVIKFTRNDIVRSGFVKKFIIACEDLELY